MTTPPEASRQLDRKTVLCRWPLIAGLAAILVGAALFLWPLHGTGLSGNALWPHYRPFFGWTTYAPLPAHPTLDDLRRAGVAIPQDQVNARRRLAGIVTVAGLLAAGLALIGSPRVWVALAARRARTAA